MPAPSTFREEYQARPQYLGGIRRDVERFVLGVGGSADLAFAVKLAVSEACADAVLRTPASPEIFNIDVRAQLDEDASELRVTVHDGRRVKALSNCRMPSFSDSFELRTNRTIGTLVLMGFRFTNPERTRAAREALAARRADRQVDRMLRAGR